MQPTIDIVATNIDSLIRLMFLIFQFVNFVMIAIGNCLFLSFRMCRANQINITKVEPRRQMACTDSIESIAVLMQQYQGFVVPFLINLFMLAVSMDGGASKEDCAVIINYLYGQGA